MSRRFFSSKGGPVRCHVRFVVRRISADEQFESGSHFNDIFGYFGVAAFFPAQFSRMELVEDYPTLTVPKCAIGERFEQGLVSSAKTSETSASEFVHPSKRKATQPAIHREFSAERLEFVVGRSTSGQSAVLSAREWWLIRLHKDIHQWMEW